MIYITNKTAKNNLNATPARSVFSSGLVMYWGVRTAPSYFLMGSLGFRNIRLLKKKCKNVQCHMSVFIGFSRVPKSPLKKISGGLGFLCVCQSRQVIQSTPVTAKHRVI